MDLNSDTWEARKFSNFECVHSAHTIVYGTFDLLHFGHIRLLSRAAEFGLPIVVGVSTDEFNLQKLKTAEHTYSERAYLVSQIKGVEFTFPETNWEQKKNDIKKFNAKYLVMGSDWLNKFDDLKDYVDVKILDRTPEISSTVIRNIKRTSE
jgi:glycerol-3-phosphate cytidylyltransferase